MKIGLYNLVSEAHNERYISITLQGFLADIEEKLGEKFENVSLENFNQNEYFSLIFIKEFNILGERIKITQNFQKGDRNFSE